MTSIAAWDVLLEIIALLSAAFLLGLAARKLRQDAVVGYLVAGIALGPQLLGVVRSVDTVHMLAELGVALLLFAIGLEFSWKRLRDLGRTPVLGGAGQILLTLGVVLAMAKAAGLSLAAAVVVGAAVALSSTAVVVRILLDRTELDSLHGRNALGMLLMQDLAVVPLLVVISTVGGQRSGSEGATLLAGTLLRAVLLLGAFWVVIRWVIPRLFDLAAMRRDRDSSVVLAVAACLGGTWSAHALGLSPVLGAFASGMLMGDLHYADQIRADLAPLRAAFVALFFASIGMLAAVPVARDLLLVLLLGAGLILFKASLITAVILLLRQPLRVAIRTGVVLAQMSEFSFVLLEAGRRTRVLDESIYQSFLSSAVFTLLLTPYLIALGPRIAALGLFMRRRRPVRHAAAPAAAKPRAVIVVGYGPAGKAVVNALRERGIGFLVLELNPRTVSSQPRGFPIRLGDGTRHEILERVGVREAQALVVTLPDPQAAWLVVQQARHLAPELPIVARGRYHLHAHSLSDAGATVVVNEEVLVGAQLAGHILQVVSPPKAEEPPDKIE
ncbi:MAG: hypothetical protein FJW34_03410 [Acidobacteria bacterium]|nr:hypothetical protein [Acidobacteriota bacterium]